MVEVLLVRYGDEIISNSTARNNFRQAIDSRAELAVNNSTIGEDPKPGQKKTCIVAWRENPGGPQIAYQRDEGQVFDFGRIITCITYGGQVITDKPDVYLRLHAAWKGNEAFSEARKKNPMMGLKSSCRIKLNNETLGGDPKPGQRKDIAIQIYNSAADIEPWNTYNYSEGDSWPPLDMVDEADNSIEGQLGQQGLALTSQICMSYGNLNAGTF